MPRVAVDLLRGVGIYRSPELAPTRWQPIKARQGHQHATLEKLERRPRLIEALRIGDCELRTAVVGLAADDVGQTFVERIGGRAVGQPPRRCGDAEGAKVRPVPGFIRA